MTTTLKTSIKVADEVWIATALLHRENPDRSDFSIDEIVDRARREIEEDSLRPGVYVHVVQHCVANRPPNPGRYRMLIETGPRGRRLFRTGDSYDPSREGSKIIPAKEEIPSEYWKLIEWYHKWDREQAPKQIENDPLLALRGSGKEVWGDEDGDTYIRRLREGWE